MTTATASRPTASTARPVIISTSPITTPSGITLNPSPTGLSFDFRHPVTGQSYIVFRAAPHQAGRGFAVGMWYAKVAGSFGLDPMTNGYATAGEAAGCVVGGGA